MALIKNEALLNEEMDPRLLVEKLKKEMALLKEELAMVTGEQRSDELTEHDVNRLAVPSARGGSVALSVCGC